MATQKVRVSLLLLACLISAASPAAINLMTSLGDGDDLNRMNPGDLEVKSDADDLELLGRKFEDRTVLVEEDKSYVDSSEFRQQLAHGFADAVKPKASFFAKKAIPEVSKHAKDEHDAKKAISVHLEPPVEEKTLELDEDEKLAHVLSAIRKIIEVAGRTISLKLSSAPVVTTPESADPETTTTTTAPPTNENEELPRLSPPIWSHSSEAEALSDPLRLPLVEPYDRYDRYSHSIARDIVW